MTMSEQTAIQAMEEAVRLLDNAKHTNGGQSRAECLQTLNQLLEQVCFHIDRLEAINPTHFEAMRHSLGLSEGFMAQFPTSAELVLTSAVQDTIDDDAAPPVRTDTTGAQTAS